MLRTAALLLFVVMPLAHADRAMDVEAALRGARLAGLQTVSSVQEAQGAPTPAPAPQAPQAGAPVYQAAVIAAPLAQQVRDSVVSLASLVITALIGVGVSYLKTHLNIKMNEQVTTSARGFAAELLLQMQKDGASASDATAHDQAVTSRTDTLLSRYPAYAKTLGLTRDIATSVILKQLSELAVTSPVSAPSVVVQAAEPAAPAPIPAIAESVPAAPPSPPASAAGGAKTVPTFTTQ